MGLFSLLWFLSLLGVVGSVALAIGGARKQVWRTALAASLFLVLAFQGFYQVDSGNVGIVQTFGSVHAKPINPGLHWARPFIDNVVQMGTRLKEFPIDTHASSKDLQSVHIVVSVQHSLNGEMSPQAYQQVGDLVKFDSNVVGPAVTEAIKAITAHHSAAELITEREDVKDKFVKAIQENIDATLRDKNVLGALHIANVAIKDFDFSPEFNNSIEEKVKSAQEALRAQNTKQQRITIAEADAREKELDAEAQAYATDVKSKANAAAIQREAQALKMNRGLLKLRFIQQWDGVLPQFSEAGNVVPFMNVNPVNGGSPAGASGAAGVASSTTTSGAVK